MKLIFNVDAVKFPITGVGRYTYELGCALERSGCFDDIVFWRGISRVKCPDIGNYKLAEPGWTLRTLKHTIKRLPRTMAAVLNLQQGFSALMLRKYGDYLYHGPNFYLTPHKGPKIVTVHDLSFITFPDSHPDYRLRLMNETMERIRKSADMIITVSEYTRSQIIDVYGCPKEKVQVTYEAASKDFRPRQGHEILSSLNKYDLRPGGYSLFVGTVEPRKNLGLLLDAYGCLDDKVRKRWPLVISGYYGWKSDKIHQRIKAFSKEGWVRYLGFVPRNDLPLLISGAALFLYPSLYEGFGLPPLEAMQSGVPVLVSDRTSLPEVVGNAAPTLAADDAELWTNSIQKGLEDHDWRNDSIKKGLKQAAFFSWDRCASETISAYQLILQ
ncbi:MAG: glycosyltransferase family 4 protein [Planctomycetaceae bacterium]|nr:glycosyltransferase family 4 protein [Planctomycetaceae bacterium]